MTSASVVSPEVQKIIERFFFHDKSVHPPDDRPLWKRSVADVLLPFSDIRLNIFVIVRGTFCFNFPTFCSTFS
ncbi:unnamed protein product [Calypogeia fissa]